MRAITGSAAPGRWVWALSGLVTALALAVPGTRVIVAAWNTGQPPPQETVTRTLTVPQPVTSVLVQSFGGPVQLTGGSATRVLVTETISYDKLAGGPPPPLTRSVSGGHLTLAVPGCPADDCTVGFALTLPPGLAVTAVTDGGALTARNLDATTVTVITDGGNAQIAFAAAPDSVTASTFGGLVELTVPGGPYALTIDTDGGPESVGIAASPGAPRSITVSTGGGPLSIAESGAGAGRPA